MSVMVNTYEILEVNTSTEEGKAFIGHLVDYVEQFNKMKSLESLFGFKMKITADGKTTTLECESASERDNKYVLTANGLIERSVDHVIWSTEEIDEALCGLETASAIKIETIFSLMKLLGHDYGFSYWIALLDEESKTLREAVSYKCQESYDSDPMVVAYKFDKDFAGYVDYDSTAEDVAYVKSWYSENFELRAYADEDYDDETLTKLTELSTSFAEKYNFLNDVEPPCENEFILFDTLTFSGSFEEFATDLQQIVDVLIELDADVEFSGAFTPNEIFAFASVNMVIEDGQIVVKYCNY